MRAHPIDMRAIVCGVVALTALGCGGPAPAVDGGVGDRDTGIEGDGGPGSDGGPGADGGPGHDASPGNDGGPGVDGGVIAEVCTGGVDEDGDLLTDCADSECWSIDACILADVATMVPGLVACGDPITLDATQTAAACGAIGTPPMSTMPTDCAAGTEEVTAHVFCDASGAAAALWIEERLETPRTMRMLSARRFEQTYYERASVIDWERQVSGASSREGGTGFPIHDGMDYSRGDTTGFRVITVRPVLPSDSVSRLLGLQLITSIIDLDLPMSMETRSSLRAGGLAISIPAH